MNFEFSEDQEALRDAVRRYVEKAYTFERRRKVVDAARFDRDTWQELAELGLTGLTISADYDGMGMGPVKAMVVNEELGRGLVLAPYSAAMNAALAIELYAPDAVKKAWLPRIASGEALVTLATQERAGRYDPLYAKVQAVGNASDGFRLTGKKDLAAAAQDAQGFVVSAQLDNAVVLFLVEPSPAVQVQPYLLQDGGAAGSVQFDGAPAQLICSGEAATNALHMLQDCGAADACAYGVGAMEALLKMTVDYMNTRKQFGVAIASFQALRHRVADMKMQLELARSMSYLAHLRMMDEPETRSRACSQAKMQLGTSMRKVGQEAVQLHGGIAMTDEYAAGHYFKALTQLEMSHGDSLYHQARVSDTMTETAGVFAG